MTYNSSKLQLYPLQDLALARFFKHHTRWGVENLILCGGTALARCYLEHRISYDLDFFVPHRFSAENFLQKAGRDGLILEDITVEEGGHYVTQIHAYTKIKKELMKLSIIEDVYEGMWNQVQVNGIQTEEVQGLYHRKLRTVTGSGFSEQTEGARQNARDLFDLYVLHKSVEPISKFIKRINRNGANLPVAPFCANVISMPWIELIAEYEQLECSDAYSNIDFYREVRNTLVDEAIILQKEGT